MQDIKKIKIIVGLGNPGEKYAATYHNAGILFIDYLIDKIPAKIKIQKLKIKNSEFIKFNSLIFAKPLIFMNESGKAVKAALDYFKLKPGEMLIAHDDSDIELGKYKISFARGSAGHKGIESIIKSLGTKNFWRLRIGIRNKKATGYRLQATRLKAGELVLKKIKKDDWITLQKVFEIIEAQLR